MQQHGRVLDLVWHGPLAIPQLHDWWSGYRDKDESHLYFYVLDYGKKAVAYVGRADSLARRVQEHYCSFLGLSYYLRDSQGNEAYTSDIENKLRTFDDLDSTVSVAIEETRRLRFFYARCEPSRLAVIESALIDRVKERAKQEGKDGLDCDNSRCEYHGWHDPPVIIRNSSAVGEPGAGAAMLRLFGEAPITWGGNNE